MLMDFKSDESAENFAKHILGKDQISEKSSSISDSCRTVEAIAHRTRSNIRTINGEVLKSEEIDQDKCKNKTNTNFKNKRNEMTEKLRKNVKEESAPKVKSITKFHQLHIQKQSKHSSKSKPKNKFSKPQHKLIKKSVHNLK